MLLGEELQIDAKNLNFEIFNSALYMKSGSMPLRNLVVNLRLALLKLDRIKYVLFLVTRVEASCIELPNSS